MVHIVSQMHNYMYTQDTDTSNLLRARAWNNLTTVPELRVARNSSQYCKCHKALSISTSSTHFHHPSRWRWAHTHGCSWTYTQDFTILLSLIQSVDNSTVLLWLQTGMVYYTMYATCVVNTCGIRQILQLLYCSRCTYAGHHMMTPLHSVSYTQSLLVGTDSYCH